MTLTVTDLRKRFGKLRVLRGLSFSCESGEVVALTGENGSGKSTILAILAGLLHSDGGAADIGDEPLIGRRASGRRLIGFVPEKADPPGHMDGNQLLNLVASLKQAPLPSAEVCAELGIDHLLHRPIAGLSLGQRRRLCVAAALIGEPKLLLLDEPTNGLDQEGRDALIGVLRREVERGAAIVVATHDADLIEATAARVLTL